MLSSIVIFYSGLKICIIFVHTLVVHLPFQRESYAEILMLVAMSVAGINFAFNACNNIFSISFTLLLSIYLPFVVH